MSDTQSPLPAVLVVDDKSNMLRLLEKVLSPMARVITAATATEAIRILESSAVDVVVSDLRLPDHDGLEVLKASRKKRPNAEFVLMTAYASASTALEALRLGAYDYIAKPFEPEEMRALVQRALVRAATSAGAAMPESRIEVLPGLLGVSEPMHALGDLVRRVAVSRSTVLILGETGTGKERIARAIHQLSPRSAGRFVAVNCAAIPAELLESELFGYVKGAFTGATHDRAGLFEEARGGTLFLDEIGDLRLSLQAKLTRALEERAVRRVGDAAERPVDVRLVAATHRDVQAMTEDGSFRADLWYRLNVASVHVPRLRERPEDIEMLASHFLRDLVHIQPRRITGFTHAATLVLKSYSWPGNVRQLRSAIERACVVSAGDKIEATDLPPEILESLTGRSAATSLSSLTWEQAKESALQEAGSRYFGELLDKYAGCVADAASHAGVERESFYRLMKRFGVEASAVPRRSGESEPRVEDPSPLPESSSPGHHGGGSE